MPKKSLQLFFTKKKMLNTLAFTQGTIYLYENEKEVETKTNGKKLIR